MKIALLVCGDVDKTFQHNSGSYPDMFVRLFAGTENNTDQQVELVPFDVRLNNYPRDLTVFDGFLTTGSSLSVYENLTWLYELKNFIRKLYKNGHKYFGVCFGHQLIAESLGGKVEKSSKGWMVGVNQTKIEKPQTWMTPEKSDCMVISCHQDQVVTLPPESEVIGYSLGCPYSMIKVGDHFIGIQGHPEFTKDYALPLIESRQDKIPIDTIEAAKLSFEISPDNTLLRTWIINFFSESNIGV
ncbi:MAG: hypothetical protein ABUK01_18030 [Leptospirales bacterium]